MSISKIKSTRTTRHQTTLARSSHSLSLKEEEIIIKKKKLCMIGCNSIDATKSGATGEAGVVVYCISAAASRATSAEDATATSGEAVPAAAPAIGDGAGEDAGALKSCAEASTRTEATAISSTATTRGAI
uniref:Uncharacterized protein n=1 Tax=Oryza punctata TaxID=4537 RepID=A0A0E0LB12_ORYPU